MKSHRRQHERAATGASALDVDPKEWKGSRYSRWAKRCRSKARRRLARYDSDEELLEHLDEGANPDEDEVPSDHAKPTCGRYLDPHYLRE